MMRRQWYDESYWSTWHEYLTRFAQKPSRGESIADFTLIISRVARYLFYPKLQPSQVNMHGILAFPSHESRTDAEADRFDDIVNRAQQELQEEGMWYCCERIDIETHGRSGRQLRGRAAPRRERNVR